MPYLPLKIFNQEMNAVAVVSSVSQDCTRKVVLGLHNTHEINRLQQTLESAKSSQNCLDGNFLYIYWVILLNCQENYCPTTFQSPIRHLTLFLSASTIEALLNTYARTRLCYLTNLNMFQFECWEFLLQQQLDNKNSVKLHYKINLSCDVIL